MPTRFVYGQVQLSAMNWPLYVAQECGFFAAQGLAAEAKIFTAPPEPVTQLVRGELDAISVIPDVTLLEMEKGAPLALIASVNPRPQYRLLAHPGKKNLLGLKGGKIGVNDVRSAESLILHRLLQRNLLAPDSYELVAAGPPPQRCEQLEQGLLTATMVTQPFDFGLQERGFRCLGSSLEVVPHYPFTVGVVRRDERINEGVLKFLHCIKMAWLWLADPDHRPEATAILRRYTKGNEKQAEGTYDLYLKPPIPPSLAPDPRGISAMLELLVEGGRISPPKAPVQKYIDSRYVKRLEYS